jgi:hypothetical protein
MYPWLFLWSPQLNWNFSQDVAPVTDWDLASIPPGAGDARFEKQALQVASYGKQLGLITEVLLNQAGSDRIGKDQALQSRRRLEQVYDGIEASKKATRLKIRKALIEQLESLKAADQKEFKYVMNQVGSALPAK